MLALSIRQPYAELIPSASSRAGSARDQDGGAAIAADVDVGERFHIYACKKKAAVRPQV
jgi:hypothetical protein